MNFVDIIAHKQAGLELSSAEIKEAMRGYTNGAVPDYQMAAMLMAIYFKGMGSRETADLVKAMTASGKVADLSGIPGRKVDKHSTGGVGDKVSLIVAPIVASCGVPVPMISGRGLGHTGGTLDKLESIPGFTTQLSVDEFVRQVGEIGCALIGQTEEIVPADRKMYALRDVTGTVGSLPLIAGSILSKKIAEGADALLLDVKFGSGAFFPQIEDARRLAQLLVTIGEELGLEISALLTDMDQPLGQAVGNWLEVLECLQVMRGDAKPDDLVQLSLSEAALMLMLGGKTKEYGAAYRMALRALTSGQALNKFIEIARRQKADVKYLETPSLYREAGCRREIRSAAGGYISRIDALAIGQAAVSLGAGRLRKEDRIDHTAGIFLHHKRGDNVAAGEPLASIHAASEEKIDSIEAAVSAAFEISDSAPPARSLIHCEITRSGERPWSRS